MLVAQSCPTLCDPMHCSSRALLSMGFPRRDNGVSSHSILQGSFLTQGLNPGLLHCRQILYCLSYQGGSPFVEWSHQAQVNMGQVEGAESLTHPSPHHCYETLVCWVGCECTMFTEWHYFGCTLSREFSLSLEDPSQLGLEGFLPK